VSFAAAGLLLTLCPWLFASSRLLAGGIWQPAGAWAAWCMNLHLVNADTAAVCLPQVYVLTEFQALCFLCLFSSFKLAVTQLNLF